MKKKIELTKEQKEYLIRLDYTQRDIRLVELGYIFGYQQALKKKK